MLDELIAGFDEDVFCRFLNSRFAGSFSASRNQITLKKGFAWESAKRLGIVKTLAGSNNSNMPLLAVAVKLHDGETLKERSSRIKQFKFAKQVLDDAMSNPAPGVGGVFSQGLFVFYDERGNFRLSLVFGKAEGTRLVWSTARRSSFYVKAGAGNKTFRDRTALAWNSFDKLKDAFSVEKLTTEFYGKLFAWYQRAMDSNKVVFPNDVVKDKEAGEVKSEQIIRLITRLMFVWFLKQKHLVPDNLFDPAALKIILEDFNPLSGDNYYRAILQNLFFATLNSEIEKREFAVDAGNKKDNREHFDIKTLYRYGREFAGTEKEVLKLFYSIPFLNGGLFECLDRGGSYFDGFSRESSKQAKVPNQLFFDESEGLIPLLNQYNFTVEENSPGDEEVALDPELLGKVFENLLGAYNPETEVAARNATGSFYTPREIVNYMVDESLIAHICGKLTTEHTGKEISHKAAEAQREDWEKVVRRLFTDGERPACEALCKKMDEALVSAKILDPACGSGAFPMGILLRMVELLRILRNIPEEQSVYDLKLELIENCIYGGDIQCIAVQITKLRFFISLVCEEGNTGSAADGQGRTGILACPASPCQTQAGMPVPPCAENNYGIHTLPNLETKFVAADSLIGLPKSGDALDLHTGNIDRLKDELFEIRHQHFLAKTYQEKKNLRKLDKLKRDEIKTAVKQAAKPDKERLAFLEKERVKVAEPKWEQITAPEKEQPEMFSEFVTKFEHPELTYDTNERIRKELDAAIARENKKVSIPSTVIDSIAEMLAAWDPYDQNSSANFSDPEWMFNVRDGFDIVIGNPPYVNVELVSAEKKLIYKERYTTFFKRFDLFGLFYEASLLRLTTKQGVVSFIVPQQIANNLSYSKLRNLMLDNAWLRDVLYLGDKVFEAANNDVCVLSLSKAGNKSIRLVYALDFDNHQMTVVPNGYFKQYGNVISFGSDTDGEAIFQKMFASDRWRLRDKFKVFQGIVTGNNTAFLPTPEQVQAAGIEPELLKPVLLGRDFGKWAIRSTARQILYVTGDTPINKYPNAEKWLLRFKDELMNNRSASERSTAWYCLHRPRVKSELDFIPKLMVQGTRNPRLVKRVVATLDDQGIYGTQGVNFILPQATDVPICFLLAVLNSTLINYLYATKFLNVAIKAEYLKDTPIPNASESVMDKVSGFARSILAAKKADPAADTSTLEAEIDELVYKLYGLTPEEIAIVKASVGRKESSTGIPACDDQTPDTGIPACGDNSMKTQTGMSVPPSRKKRKAQLPPSLPGWD